MLVGISPLIGPDLLAALCRMGHGDEIVLADANFPACSLGPPVIRADGLAIAPLLDGIARLFPLDTYVDCPIGMMAAVPGARCGSPPMPARPGASSRTACRVVSTAALASPSSAATRALCM